MIWLFRKHLKQYLDHEMKLVPYLDDVPRRVNNPPIILGDFRHDGLMHVGFLFVVNTTSASCLAHARSFNHASGEQARHSAHIVRSVPDGQGSLQQRQAIVQALRTPPDLLHLQPGQDAGEATEGRRGGSSSQNRR